MADRHPAFVLPGKGKASREAINADDPFGWQSLLSPRVPHPLVETICEVSSSSRRRVHFSICQSFLVRYLGRSPCEQLVGVDAVRSPIDRLVFQAQQLLSVDELPSVEVRIDVHGLAVINRHQHGLIPLENISYAMRDLKYSRVGSCIVLRQSMEIVSECYVFLFGSREDANRFPRALAQAFQSAKSNRPID